MKILYIMSSYNVYGGTPKKTLDLLRHFGKDSVLYVYNNIFQEFKGLFELTGAKVFEGCYGWNLVKHLRELLLIIDEEGIDIVQTQFSLGEGLGILVKLFRPSQVFSNQFWPKFFTDKWMLSYSYLNILKQKRLNSCLF